MLGRLGAAAAEWRIRLFLRRAWKRQMMNEHKTKFLFFSLVRNNSFHLSLYSAEVFDCELRTLLWSRRTQTAYATRHDKFHFFPLMKFKYCSCDVIWCGTRTLLSLDHRRAQCAMIECAGIHISWMRADWNIFDSVSARIVQTRSTRLGTLPLFEFEMSRVGGPGSDDGWITPIYFEIATFGWTPFHFNRNQREKSWGENRHEFEIRVMSEWKRWIPFFSVWIWIEEEKEISRGSA